VSLRDTKGLLRQGLPLIRTTDGRSKRDRIPPEDPPPPPWIQDLVKLFLGPKKLIAGVAMLLATLR
jgi:hypothetical protein